MQSPIPFLAVGLFFAVLAVLFLSVLAVIGGNESALTQFAKVAGVGLTVVFSGASLLVGMATERTKVQIEQAKLDIEKAKKDALFEIEKLKAQLQVEFEHTKRNAELHVRAYELAMKAAGKFFRAIEAMASGKPDPATIKEAEEAMNDADAFSPLFGRQTSEKWYEFWQHGRNIIDAASGKGPDDVRSIWKESGGRFGKLLAEFQACFTSAHKVAF